MNKSIKVLERNRKEVFRKMPKTDKIIKGTLVLMHNKCGKPNCKCKKGERHICLALSRYVKGKTKMTYIPKVIEKEAREFVQNYKGMMKCINELSGINIEIMKKQI